MTHEQLAALLREFMRSQVFSLLAELVGGPDRELRIDRAVSQLIGMAMLRMSSTSSRSRQTPPRRWWSSSRPSWTATCQPADRTMERTTSRSCAEPAGRRVGARCGCRR
jgi:hypothetical protein